MNDVKYVPPLLCLPPNRDVFPNGPTTYYYAYDRQYSYYSTNLYGYYCYALVPVAAPMRRKKSSPSPPPPVQNRVCTGSITFLSESICDFPPESFEVDFQLNPLGGLFNSTISGCDALPHERASFVCSDTTPIIRAKLLAALQPQFVGKVDFTVTKSTIGTGFDNFVTSIELLPDGKMIIGGAFTSYNGTPSNRIIILNPDFSVFQTTLGTGFDNTVNAITLLSNGDIVVVGNFTTYNGLASQGIIILNPDLTVDTLAQGAGFVNPSVNAVTILNGNIVVGGGFDFYNGIAVPRGIIILNPDLTVNTTGVGTGIDNAVQELTILNGNIVVGGSFSFYDVNVSRNIIILNPDLTINTVTVGLGFNTSVFALGINSSGQIVAGGTFATYNLVASSGIIILDSTLNIVTTAAGTGFVGGVQALVVKSNGDIVAGGAFTTYNGESSEGIIILNADLTRDTLADGTGFGPFPNVLALAVQPDEKIVVGGFITGYNGIAANHIIRLNPDLTVDVASNDTYTIEVTYTDLSSTPTPTSLLGTILENCVVIENQTDMNLICVIS